MYILQKALTLFIGSLLVAIGVNLFLVPFGLLDGGAIGISLIIHYAMGVKVGLTFLIVSIPIFMLAWKYYRSFLQRNPWHVAFIPNHGFIISIEYDRKGIGN